MPGTPTINPLVTKEFLTFEEVAWLLSCTKRHIFRMVATGELPQPYRRNHKFVRFWARDIKKWLEDLRNKQ